MFIHVHRCIRVCLNFWAALSAIAAIAYHKPTASISNINFKLILCCANLHMIHQDVVNRNTHAYIHAIVSAFLGQHSDWQSYRAS